jgi:hypothetical protein
VWGNLVGLKPVLTTTIRSAIQNFAAGKGGHGEEFLKGQMYTFYPQIVHKIALYHSEKVRYLGVFVKTVRQ